MYVFLDGHRFVLEPLNGVLSVFKVRRDGSAETIGYIQRLPRQAILPRGARAEGEKRRALLLRVLEKAESSSLFVTSSR